MPLVLLQKRGVVNSLIILTLDSAKHKYHFTLSKTCVSDRSSMIAIQYSDSFTSFQMWPQIFHHGGDMKNIYKHKLRGEKVTFYIK